MKKETNTTDNEKQQRQQTTHDKATHYKNKNLETEPPLAEKDEVKKAEERMQHTAEPKQR